jgi:hypothetical protein
MRKYGKITILGERQQEMKIVSALVMRLTAPLAVAIQLALPSAV